MNFINIQKIYLNLTMNFSKIFKVKYWISIKMKIYEDLISWNIN
jgi:hypothetical protein